MTQRAEPDRAESNRAASNLEWEKWGEVDPLYGVASWSDRGRDGATPWTDEAFYALGESDWRDFKTAWEEYGVRSGRCVEIGCGAGRLTMQLAKSFESVTAFDVSPGMLAYAAKNVTAPNVRFVHSDGTVLEIQSGGADAIFSTHVFQHFESTAIARSYFVEMARVLSTGGSIMIHLPVYAWPGSPSAHRLLHRLRSRLSDMRAGMARRRIAAGKWVPLMRGLVYEQDWLFAQLEQIGFQRVQLKTFRVSSNGALHTFLLATKPPA